MELHYKKFGSGDPVVILHGLYGSSDNWAGTAKELAAAGFEVYLVDQRNHGNSPHDDRHDYESMRDDLLELLDKTGLKNITLAGHSMGGKTAMCFASHHPGLIKNLIIVDIAPKSYKDIYRNEKLSHYDILKAMKSIDPSGISVRREADRMLEPVIKSSRIRAFLMKNLKRNDEGKFYWALNLDVLLRELDNIMDGVSEKCFDRSSPLENLPVMFIRGDRSDYIRNEDMDSIRQIFPRARLETIHGAGHWVHAEQPAAFIGLVKGFTGGSRSEN
jgi:esterase